jgi:hypothetical protein
MSPLHQALVDYLAIRRALGYKLEREGTSCRGLWTSSRTAASST